MRQGLNWPWRHRSFLFASFDSSDATAWKKNRTVSAMAVNGMTHFPWSGMVLAAALEHFLSFLSFRVCSISYWSQVPFLGQIHTREVGYGSQPRRVLAGVRVDNLHQSYSLLSSPVVPDSHGHFERTRFELRPPFLAISHQANLTSIPVEMTEKIRSALFPLPTVEHASHHFHWREMGEQYTSLSLYMRMKNQWFHSHSMKIALYENL